jgi:sugar lactone lactonase YvrE
VAFPESVAINASGYLYIGDMSYSRIQEFDRAGLLVGQWGLAAGSNGQTDFPRGLAVNRTGYIYAADNGNCRVQVFDSAGNLIAQWGEVGDAPGQFSIPSGISVNASGTVYVADTYNDRIQIFDPTGTYIMQWRSQGRGDSQFETPYGIATDSGSDVYVADSGNNRIVKYSFSTPSLPASENLTSTELPTLRTPVQALPTFTPVTMLQTTQASSLLSSGLSITIIAVLAMVRSLYRRKR